MAGLVIPWILSRRTLRWRLAPPFPSPFPPFPRPDIMMLLSVFMGERLLFMTTTLKAGLACLCRDDERQGNNRRAECTNKNTPHVRIL
jgi:hypothetical protein